MGYYTTDPAELARMNAGLPPDERVGVVYVMAQHERERAERLDREAWITAELRRSAQARAR